MNIIDKLDNLEKQLYTNKRITISKDKPYWKDCKYHFNETLNGDYLGILKGIPINVSETDTEITFSI